MSFCLGSVAVCFARSAPAADNGLGTITGTVRLDGVASPIPQGTARHDAAVCGQDPRPLQSLLVDSRRAVEEVIIYLGKVPSPDSVSGQEPPPVVLDQRDCWFVPRIQAGRSGAPLILRNSDPVLNIVRIQSMSSTNGPQDLLLAATPYAGYEKKYAFANFHEPALLKVQSDSDRPWMLAYVAILPHPWFDLTNDAGQYTLTDVPAGVHKLYAWHEVLGTLTREVRVVGGRTVTLDLGFSPKR